MIRTEYTRQVPIKHWLPTVFDYLPDVGYVGSYMETIITGYKQQRAWDLCRDHTSGKIPTYITDNKNEALMRGQEVEGFEWIDEPIVGE